MANGMGSLYIGASGLHSAQTGLNTTAHNIANINTTGYTRQQIVSMDSTYLKVGTMGVQIGKSGLGVSVDQIRRIRDQFIDSAYRSENSRLGFYEGMYNAVEEVEDLFGEMQGITFQETMNNLYTAFSELEKNPMSTVARSAVIQYSSAFVERSNTIYRSLRDYQETLNTDVRTSIEKINELGNTIFNLNRQIQKVECASTGESANDLRDRRDNALDQLSKLANISYNEDHGKILVTCEGIPFVCENNVNEMSSRTIDGTTLLVPTWPAFGKDVYNVADVVSAKKNVDKGSLKGIIVARGSQIANYTDVPEKPEREEFPDTAEGNQQYEDAYAEYEQKQDYYNKYIEPSPILSAMAGLDKLVNAMVESINDVLCPEKEITTTAPMTDSNGNEIAPVKVENGVYTYKVLDLDKTDYGMDENKTVGTELFSRKGTDRYIKTTDANGNDVYVRNNINAKGDEVRYSIGYLKINDDAAQNVAYIPLTTITGGEDFDRASEILEKWNDKFGSLNPEFYSKNDYVTYYSNFIGKFATEGKVYNNYVENGQTMVSGYDNQRLQIEGVSSDEELQKMIKFQQAYNAASRYFNVVDDMIEHLVTSLGNA